MKRRARQDQFENPITGAWITTSPSLANCARSDLVLSLEDRHREVSKSDTTHYSDHAIGAINNLTAAFEAWLNESVWQLGFGRKELLQLTKLGMVERYTELVQRTSTLGVAFAAPLDLQLLVDVRHEIDHFLPRTVNTSHGLPEWLGSLTNRHLLLESAYESLPDFDVASSTPLGQRFMSYSLAYWAFETVESAINAMAGPLGEHWDWISHTSTNFSNYRDVWPPSRLVEHDDKCPGLLNQAFQLTLMT